MYRPVSCLGREPFFTRGNLAIALEQKACQSEKPQDCCASRRVVQATGDIVSAQHPGCPGQDVRCSTRGPPIVLTFEGMLALTDLGGDERKSTFHCMMWWRVRGSVTMLAKRLFDTAGWAGCVAQWLAVCRRSERSKPLTHSPPLALGAIVGSSVPSRMPHLRVLPTCLHLLLLASILHSGSGHPGARRAQAS